MTRSSDISGRRTASRWCCNCSLAAMTLLGAVLPTVALAQVQNAADAGAQDAAEPRVGAETQDIIVTARRRAESINNVPITIQAVSEDRLRDAGVSNIMGLNQFSPGLNVAGGVDGNTSRFFIRGVGTVTPTFGVEQAVPVYIDDVYTPLGLGGSLELFSIDRVEVLSGPQGTLYGRNSFGGAIKIYSKQFTNETEAYVTGEYGSFNQRNVKAEILTPIVADHLWLGAAYARIRNDGVQKLVEINERGWSDDKDLYRLRLEAKPVEGLTAKLSYERSDDNGAAKAIKIEPGTNGDVSTPVLGGLTRIGSLIQSTPILRDADPDHIETDVNAKSVAKIQSITGSINYEISDKMNVIYLGARRKLHNVRVFDIDGSPSPFIPVIEDISLDATSHELQYQFNSARFNLVAGAFRYKETTDVFSYNGPNAFAASFIDSIDPNALSVLTDVNGRRTGVNSGTWGNPLYQTTRSTAFFANAGLSLTSRLKATVGVRHTRDKKFQDSPIETQYIVLNPSLSATSGNVVPVGGIRRIPLPGGLTDPNNYGFNFGAYRPGQPGVDAYGVTGPVARTFKATTFEATLDYHPTDDILVFGSFKQGFQGGLLFPNSLSALAATNFNAVPQSTKAQKINAFELGTKASLFDRRLQINASAYYYDFSDLVLSVSTAVPIIVNATGFIAVPQNAASARSVGFDIEGSFAVTDRLKLRANAGYVDFKLGTVLSQVAGPGGTVSEQDISDTFNDKYVAASPRFKANLGGEYFIPAEGIGNFRVFANASYRSKMNTNGAPVGESSGFGLLPKSFTLANFLSPSLVDLSGGLSFYSTDDHIRVDLTGANLLNKRRFENTVFDSTGFFGVGRSYNRPRTFRVAVTYKM